MKNNRLYNRYSVKCSGNIVDNSLRNYRFVMNNISACGMNITTEKKIVDENTLTIYFDQGEIIFPHIKQLKGRIVRKKTDDSVYNYAVRFFNVTNMEIVEIDEYLRFRHFSSLVNMIENPNESAYMR